MLALSIKQPWAWLIVNGYKDVENRMWLTKVRGEVLVHAGRSFDHDGYRWVRQAFPCIPLPAPEDFDLGGIVGQVRITGCVEQLASPWFFGPYGFTLIEPRPLPFKPCKGALKFFKIDKNP